MTATPARVSDALYDKVAAAFSGAQIIELTATIAWENFRARQNRALGVESDGFSEGAKCPVPVWAHSQAAVR